MKRIIFHIDVNNAFLSWSAIEMLKEGSKVDIRNIASVVGGDETKRRGVVVAKSMPAKKAGIITGEPIYQARKKVDNLFVVRSNKSEYVEYSNKLYNYLCNYSPVIERYSIDECFLDMTGTEMMFGDLVKLAYKIKDDIKQKFGFTVNVGIANNKVCAKMASDFEKPDRVHTLFDDEVKEKMWPLKVDDLFMVGKKTAKTLHELGFDTIRDVANSDINLLIKYFKNLGKLIWQYANGIDDSIVEKTIPKNKGIGHSTTLPKDAVTIGELKKVLFELSSMVGIRLRNEGKYALVVSVQLRNNEFFNYQHQKKLINPISSNEDIYNVSCELLEKMWLKDPIRLVGLRVTDLTTQAFEQVSLFEKPGEFQSRDKIQKTLDKINQKYGTKIIKSASELNKKE